MFETSICNLNVPESNKQTVKPKIKMFWKLMVGGGWVEDVMSPADSSIHSANKNQVEITSQTPECETHAHTNTHFSILFWLRLCLG